MHETVFLKLKYLRHLFNLAVKQFVVPKVADQQHIPSTDTITHPIIVIMPCKDQVSANVMKKRLTDLSPKINTAIQPVFMSRKLKEDLKVREVKPAIIKQQCLQVSICAMQNMLVTLAATTNALMDTSKNRRQFVNIILANLNQTYHLVF